MKTSYMLILKDEINGIAYAPAIAEESEIEKLEGATVDGRQVLGAIRKDVLQVMLEELNSFEARRPVPR